MFQFLEEINGNLSKEAAVNVAKGGKNKLFGSLRGVNAVTG